MIDRRTFMGGLAAASAAVVLGGCGDAPAQSEADAPAPHASWLHLAIKKPVSIDPYDVCDQAGYQVVTQVFEPLMRYDVVERAVRGLTATSVEVSDDACAFTFHLAEGRTFHSGEPVTAQAFKRAWTRLVAPGEAFLDEAGPSPHASLLALVEGYDALRADAAIEFTGISCPDDLTLVVHLSAPCAEFPAIVCHPALSPVPQAAIDDPAGFADMPIGNGPYRLVDGLAGADELLLARVEDSGAQAGVEGVVIDIDSEAAASFKQFEAGNLDVCQIPIDRLDAAREGMGVAVGAGQLGDAGRVLRVGGPATTFVVCNVDVPPFDDVRVRAALSHAIDRDALCEKVLRGVESPASGPVAPALASSSAFTWPACSFDVERASELLDEVYPEEDGVRDLAVKILCRKGGTQARVASHIASELQAVGIAASTEVLEGASLAARLAAGDFTCAMLTWTPDFPSVEAAVRPLLHAGPREGTNRSGYSNEKVDEAFDKARRETSASRRQGLLADAVELAGKDLPIVPVSSEVVELACSPRLERVEVGLYGAVIAAGCAIA